MPRAGGLFSWPTSKSINVSVELHPCSLRPILIRHSQLSGMDVLGRSPHGKIERIVGRLVPHRSPVHVHCRRVVVHLQVTVVVPPPQTAVLGDPAAVHSQKTSPGHIRFAQDRHSL
jgi:hypothetical protein